MINALQAIIARPKTVLTLMVVMLVAGIMAYISIPKEANPDIDVPVYFVSVSQQGISPGDAERLLVRPMETALRGLDGLDTITATASEGYAGIVLEFDIATDKDQVIADIRDKVDEASAELPEEANEPTITETNFALAPTIIVTLSGNVPERTMTRMARRLKDEIEAISTVREANLTGNRDELLEVILDLEKLESYDISQDELLNALSQNNRLVPAGFIDNGQGRFNVKVPGLVESPADVGAIVLRQSGEGIVSLSDVATIRPTFKDPSSFTRVNGEPAISVEVVKRIGTNIIENNEEVRRVVGEFTKDWPDAINVKLILDESETIFEVLGSLEASILTAISLVLICVVGVLGIRSGLLVGFAIPMSFMVSFLILSALGMTVNQMVMFGMVLTVGMLVDGAIVVTEYADRKISEGVAPDEAYKRAARLMFWPVVSSTATTLAAFLPLLLWPGVPGEFMSYLPKMVIIVLTASLLTALVFLPVTGTLLGQISATAGRHARAITALLFGALAGLAAFGAALALGQPAAILAASLAFLAVFLVVIALWRPVANLLPVRRKTEDKTALMLSSRERLDIDQLTGFTQTYLRWLNRFTGNLYGNLLAIALIVGLTSFSVFYFAQNSNGVEFFIEEEPDRAVVLVSARGNLGAAEVRDIVGEVEREVLKVSGIENVVTTASAPGGGGAPQILGGVQDKPADVVGELQIELADYCCRRKAVDIFADIRTNIADIAGVKIEIVKIEGGPPTGKDLNLEVRSTSYDDMVASVARIRDHVDTIDILTDQEDGRPLPGIEWRLEVDRTQAGRYNAGIAQIGSMVQLVTNGVLIGTYRPEDSEEEVDIRVRLPDEQRSLDRLDELRLRTPNGQVPLSNFVSRTAEPQVTSITRRDGLYSMSVKASLAPGATFGDRSATPTDVVSQVDGWLKEQEWPDSVQLVFRGADEEQEESGAFLGKAAIGALFLMFMILVTQFNSFYQAILTLLTVVLAVCGVLLGMALTGQSFSIIMTGTGVVALAGIVVNNAIVLIDTFNRLVEEGVTEIRQAVLKTAAQRLRPIMLTTVTTILGLVPMALQINMNFFERTVSFGSITSFWWVQLSTAVISGLAFSTVLTLFMIPVLLALPSNFVAEGHRFGHWGRLMAGWIRPGPRGPTMPEDQPATALVAANDSAAGQEHRHRKDVYGPYLPLPEAAE